MDLIINGLQKIAMKLFGTEIVETFQCEQDLEDTFTISMTNCEVLFPLNHENIVIVKPPLKENCMVKA